MANNVYFVDLFCGAGGTSTGMIKAGASVLACVNHDTNAIQSHLHNHPGTLHFTEDIRDLKMIRSLGSIVSALRKERPDAKIVLHASLECTNFSNAKGGLPRDADSRSLADHMPLYINAIDPDIFTIENVREFLSWGPLNDDNRPIKELKGIDFNRWCEGIHNMGYHSEYRILNSADYGARQARKRLFMQFAKPDITIKWAVPTNTKETYLPVRDVLELHDIGKSIFERKKPLADNTIKRIKAGILKFVNKDSSFISTYCIDSVNEFSHSSTESKYNLATPFIDNQYGNGYPSSVDKPLGTITTSPKQALVTPQWLLNPQYNSKGNPIDKPCFTLIARMDKTPPYLMSAVRSTINKITISDSDSMVMRDFKELLISLKISNISMRMLKIPELLQIQGFPADYILEGTQAEQKKYIGNAVEVNCAEAFIKAIIKSLIK